MNRRITVKYCFLQGGYWTLAAVAMAFTTPLLEAKGFSGTEIGILSAVKYLAVLIFQMVLGSFADKHAEKVPLQRMLILMTFVNIIFSFLFYLTGHTMWMAMLTLIVFGMTIHCASPLVDSLSIQYMNHGVKMNYAISRACGSLCWAVFCVVVGLIADAFGTNRILIFQIVVSFLFAFFAFNMDAVDFSKERKKEEKSEDLASENSDTKCETGEVHSCFYLLKHFPKYSLFLLGLVFVFAAYNMNSTFLIDWIEGMGGNHADYGMAQFVLAMAEIPVALVFYRIRGRVSIDKLMVVCAFFCFLRATATTFSGSVTLVILSQALELLGLSIYYVGTVYFVMDYLPQADAVKGASLINLAGMGLGEMAGSISCGLIKDALGLRNLMLLSSGVGFVGVVVMVWMWRSGKGR